MILVSFLLIVARKITGHVTTDIIDSQYEVCNVVYFSLAREKFVNQLRNIFANEPVRFHFAQKFDNWPTGEKLIFENSNLFGYTENDIILFKKHIIFKLNVKIY